MPDLVLDREGRKALEAALLAAFPTRNALARLVAHGLGENLAALVGEGPLRDVVFELVGWAAARGRLGELVAAARTENPGNPDLSSFVAGRGVQQPPPPAPAPAIPPGIPVDTTDPEQLARIIRAHLVWRYPEPGDAMRLAADAGVDRTRVDFTGPKEVFWADTVNAARQSGRLSQLVAAARAEYPQDAALARFASQLAAAPVGPPTRWTPERMYDALLRLLPVQLEDVVFRLAVPAYYLPPPNAPVAERAQGLVRLLEQQSRLGDLAAQLDRMKLTPR